MDKNKTKSGFISLIGRPNSGKSTLLNQIIGQKISITSHKPQTTRNRILGIKTIDNYQMVFMDTPGIHNTTKLLNTRIVKSAIKSANESTLNLILVEPSKTGLKQTKSLLKTLDNDLIKRSWMIINKTDKVSPNEVLTSIDIYSKLGDFKEIIPLSALKGHNVDYLLDVLKKNLPDGPFYFETDALTDVSMRFIASEFIREELFKRLQSELPYQSAVIVESYKETQAVVKIYASIIVEQESQKKIVIGKHGAMIKSIGIDARKKIEQLLQGKVYLDLLVKVEKNWSSNQKFLNNIGITD